MCLFGLSCEEAVVFSGMWKWKVAKRAKMCWFGFFLMKAHMRKKEEEDKEDKEEEARRSRAKAAKAFRFSFSLFLFWTMMMPC